MSAPTTQRARCRVCLTRHKVTADGRLTDHASPAGPDVACDGAGYLPAPEPAR